METASYQPQLQALGQALHSVLQQDVPVPVDVRCVMKQGKLLVLAQHPPDISLDAKRVFALLKTAIKSHRDDLLYPLLADTSTLPVQLYLRVQDQPQPYAFYPFQLDLDPEESLDSRDLMSSLDETPASWDSTPEDVPATPGSPPKRSRRLWLGLLIAGVVVLGGAAAYLLTRPCVIGGCRPLEQAETLFTQSQQAMAQVESADDVRAVYEQLVEARYLTTRVPQWSGYHETAQAQRDRYDRHTEAISRVMSAQRDAFAAAQRSQNPPHPIPTWEEIRDLWESAIAHLEAVPADSPIADFAQRKLAEYQSNLAVINQRIEQEQDAQSRVRSAREMAQRATDQESSAIMADQWQSAYTAWQIAIDILKPIPAQTMSHAEAQQLLSIYNTRVADLRDRLSQEERSTAIYRQSLQLANQASTYEQQEQWSRAVSTWQDALSQVQQVPVDSSYHEQMQPLVNSYSLALEDAQQNLRLAIAAQRAQAELDKLCAGPTPPCTYQVSRNRTEVWLTIPQTTAIPFPQPDRPGTVLNPPLETLLHQIAQVGTLANVEIDVYTAEGNLFGRYVPTLSGYVPPTYVEVLDRSPTP
jgi:hypothetical protein